jgi:hypothetical protein
MARCAGKWAVELARAADWVMGVPPEALATFPLDAIATAPNEGMRTTFTRKTSSTLRLRTGG